MRPRVAAWAQPIAQFLAAFPANLVFPIFVIAIIRFHLNVNIWAAPLMILGTQWYILFNVVAGASAIPRELRLAIDNMQVRGFLKWKRFLLPAVFPYYVTGAITAAGGAWNASIVAEVISWGNQTLQYSDPAGSNPSLDNCSSTFLAIRLSISLSSGLNQALRSIHDASLRCTTGFGMFARLG